MSPLRKNAILNRRAFLKRSGVAAALVALPLACRSVEPVIAGPAADPITPHTLLVGLTRGDTLYCLNKILDVPAALTFHVTCEGKRYEWSNPLSPGAERILDACMAQFVELIELEESEEGWE